MGFSYEVMSEKDAMNERFQLLKEGIYEAVITASSDTVSSKGHPMMDMTVTVYDQNGATHDVRDFLVFTKPMMWKIVHFADSADMLKEYESGTLCSETAINKRCVVKIVIEEGSEIPQDKLKGKPLGTRYYDKNKIEDYIKKSDQGAALMESNHNNSSFLDDAVPFL